VIWDNNDHQDFSVAVNDNDSIVNWVGNVEQFPVNENLGSNSDLWLNLESWPQGAAAAATVSYTTDAGATWTTESMAHPGMRGNNDWWNINLGQWAQGTEIEYYFQTTDGVGSTMYDNNSGANYLATVERAAYRQYAFSLMDYMNEIFYTLDGLEKPVVVYDFNADGDVNDDAQIIAQKFCEAEGYAGVIDVTLNDTQDNYYPRFWSFDQTQNSWVEAPIDIVDLFDTVTCSD